jgi:hypothetical protein
MTAQDAADRLEQLSRQEQVQNQANLYSYPGVMFKALKKFRLMNGPSSSSTFLIIAPDDLFSLDGDEPISERDLIDGGFAERIR